uniref:C-type lectin domain-containing protein n=1 Tax=Terrapene triunguis TaxID=2587831 RepID=A0A674JXD3_9SAUR
MYSKDIILGGNSCDTHGLQVKGSDRQDKFVASTLIGCQNYLASSEWKYCLVFRYGHVLSDFRYSEQWLILPIFMFPVFLLDSPASAPPWKIIAVILGIFCLILLGVSVALAIKRKYFQERHRVSDLNHSCPGCPDQWVRYRDSCYYFSNVKRDWNSSRNFCSAQDSGLLVISDTKEKVYDIPSTILSISGWVHKTVFFFLPQPSSQMQLIPVHHQHTVMHVAASEFGKEL